MIQLNQTIIRSARAALFSLLFLTAASLPGIAQTELTGGVRGVITTLNSNEVIANAKVILTCDVLRVRRETKTDSAGRFAFLGLPPGVEYRLTVSAENFSEATREALTISSGEALDLSVPLEVRQITESVTVTDTAPALISDRPEISQLLDARRISELPSNGRSLSRFALTNPHVRTTAGLGSDGNLGSRLAINAASFRSTHYKLDGTNNYDTYGNAPQLQVSLAAVQEFKVLTNQFGAEYGGTTSGIISTTTKSGTAQFHGEGFFFGRPSGIQAAPPISTRHTPNELLQFGGAVGGPLNGDRTTFFTSVEHARLNRGAFIQSPTPSVYVGHGRDYLALARLDHQLNERHALTARASGNYNSHDNANDRVSGFMQPSTATVNAAQGIGGQIAERMVVGTAVNEARFNYANSVPFTVFPVVASVSIVRPNYATEGGSSYTTVRSQIWQLSDQLTWQRGAHELKFGGDYLRQKVGDFSFSPFGTYTFAPGPPTANQQPLQYTQTFGAAFVRYGQTLISAFAQDNWKLTSRLTTNLGLRYEYQSMTTDRNNFAPRLGLAWDVRGDGKTIVRAGAGVYYDQLNHITTRRYLTLRGFSPSAFYRLTPSSPSFPVFPNSLTSAPPLQPRELFLPGDKQLNPYNLQFSLGVQRELFGGFTLTLDAIHSQTLKQQRAHDLNAPTLFVRTATAQRRTVAVADATRPLTSYEGVPVKVVNVIENTNKSVYDALDAGLVKRFARRYQFEAHYIYSAAFTYAMFFGEQSTGLPQDYRASDRQEYGPSDFMQRHRLLAHSLVELPWQMQASFVATIASGLPVNPLTGVDNNGDGNLLDRPFGFGRNSFRTPKHASFDLSLAKRVALREGIRLELRAEAFNLFNRSNPVKVNNIYGDAADGKPLATFLRPIAGVTNSDPGRQFQCGLRLIF